MSNNSLKKCYRNIKKKMIISLSKVTKENMPELEEKSRQEIANLNFEKKNRLGKISFCKTDVESVTVREITNRDDVYNVEELHYSLHHNGVVSAWQYGVGVEDAKREEHRITVSHNDGKIALTMRHKTGTYKEYGDSSTEGSINHMTLTFGTAQSKFPKYIYDISGEVDIHDKNAIRYLMRNNSEVAFFMDKFVFVKPEEKEAYKQYEAQQDKIADKYKAGKKRILPNNFQDVEKGAIAEAIRYKMTGEYHG